MTKPSTLILSIGAIFLAIIACTPKATNPPESTPLSKTAPKTAHVDDHVNSIHKGEGVFMRHCYQCHAQPPACSYSGEEWSDISLHMSDKAGLSEKETKLVRSYLISRTKPDKH